MSHRLIDFSRYSSINIGPEIPVLEISEIDVYPKHQIIGKAYNLLVSPKPPSLAVLSKAFDFMEIREGVLHVGAAAISGRLLSFAKKHDLAGFELLNKLPGSLGGLIKMNAGLKGDEISRNLQAIRTVQGWIEKEKIDFGYRRSGIETVIFEAVFAIQKGFDVSLADTYTQMRQNQPLDPSAGSCFKNPPDDYAGRLIEAVGLKGKRVGNMAFSEQHANFLVNLGEGSFEDAIHLIQEAEKRVHEKFGIVLEREIIVM